MSTVRVITPALPIVSKEEAKAHMVVSHASDDVLIESYILAATTWIDGPTGWLGRVLGVQTLEFSLSDFRCGIEIPMGPAIDVGSIVYRSADGGTVTLPANSYELIEGYIVSVGDWPSVADRLDAVKVRYRAGHGKFDTSNPPQLVNDTALIEPIKIAILMLVAHWYRTREPVAIGATVEKLPFTVEALLQPYRVYR